MQTIDIFHANTLNPKGIELLAKDLSQITEAHYPQLRKISPEKFQELIEAHKVLVAQTRGEVFQTIAGMIRYECRGGGYAEIGGVWRKPGHQSADILMEEMLGLLKAKDLKPLLITRFPDNFGMIRLAMKHGFIPVKPKDFKTDSPEFAAAVKACVVKDKEDDANPRNRILMLKPDTTEAIAAGELFVKHLEKVRQLCREATAHIGNFPNLKPSPADSSQSLV